MRISKKEIIKAIYIKLASDTLEFITIATKQELEAKTNAVKANCPNNPVIIKTFMSIEDPIDRFYKFKCEVIGQDFIAELIPCSKFNETVTVRHIKDTNQLVITINAISEDYALQKAHDIYKLMYKHKYVSHA